MNNERLELIVDTTDTYIGTENVFYLNPHRLSLARCLSDNQFSSCLIKNSPVETLTSLNLSYVLRKMNVNATLEVIICQPITVMQEYDAKQIVANGSLAGFVDAEIQDYEYVDNSDRKCKTLLVTFRKPEKNPNVVEVEVTVKKTARNEEKGKSAAPKESKTKQTKTTTTTKTVIKKK